MINTLFNKTGSYWAKALLIFSFFGPLFFGFLLAILFILIFSKYSVSFNLRVIIFLFGVAIGYIIGRIWWLKFFKVECNICGWQGIEFHDIDCGYGRICEKDTCPSCFSHIRHRSIFLYLKKILPKDKKIKVLHFAPETFLTKLFKSYKNIDYLSVDIDSKNAMLSEDIANLSFDDNTFDIIICIHVLEHVEKDQSALLELYRVLKKDGFALIDVPIDYNLEKTYENFDLKTPEERAAAFWQWDHVRLYGRDFSDKLRLADFKVTEDRFVSSLGKKKIKHFGLHDLPLYYCKKE